jgi:hypothetical protein
MKSVKLQVSLKKLLEKGFMEIKELLKKSHDTN